VNGRRVIQPAFITTNQYGIRRILRERIEEEYLKHMALKRHAFFRGKYVSLERKLQVPAILKMQEEPGFCSRCFTHIASALHFPAHALICAGGTKREREQPPEPQGCHNEDDPISLDKIAELDPENTFSLMIGDKRYCFNLDSLVQWIQHNPTNPLTRAVLTAQELADITDANARLLETRRRAAIREYRIRAQVLRERYKESITHRFGPNAPFLQIFVTGIDGKTSTVQTTPDESVDMLLRYLADVWGVDNPADFALVHQGKLFEHRLNGNTTLRRYNIRNDSTFHATGFGRGSGIAWDGPPSLLE
jgi:hypothetical protein